MKIISISGLDGSGKSTQVKMLKSYLASLDRKVFYFHAVQFGVAEKISEFKKKYCLICRLIGRCKIGGKEKSVTRANWTQIQLRKIFLKIDAWRFGGLCQKLEKGNFDYILSDRYFYDTLINIQYLSGKKLHAGNIPKQKFRKPDLAFYLNIEPENIMQRKRKPDQGLEYLRHKKALYSNSANNWNLITIDGNRGQEEVFEEIKSIIEKGR